MTATKVKKLTKGEENLIEKFKLRDYGDPLSPEKTELRYNPVSGVSCSLNPFCANLYDQVSAQYAKYERGDYSVVHWYDRLKYLLLKFDVDAYMELVD